MTSIRRITPEDQPQFPCWVWAPPIVNQHGWWWRCVTVETFRYEQAEEDASTHWSPDAPEAPSEVPTLGGDENMKPHIDTHGKDCDPGFLMGAAIPSNPASLAPSDPPADERGTPRTDAVANILAALSTRTSEQFVLADFARQLEKELNAMAEAFVIATRSADDQMFQKREAEQRNAALREEVEGLKAHFTDGRINWDALNETIAKVNETSAKNLAENIQLRADLAAANGARAEAERVDLRTRECAMLRGKKIDEQLKEIEDQQKTLIALSARFNEVQQREALLDADLKAAHHFLSLVEELRMVEMRVPEAVQALVQLYQRKIASETTVEEFRTRFIKELKAELFSQQEEIAELKRTLAAREADGKIVDWLDEITYCGETKDGLCQWGFEETFPANLVWLRDVYAAAQPAPGLREGEK